MVEIQYQRHEVQTTKKKENDSISVYNDTSNNSNTINPYINNNNKLFERKNLKKISFIKENL